MEQVKTSPGGNVKTTRAIGRIYATGIASIALANLLPSILPILPLAHGFTGAEKTGDIHEQITREALGGTICDGNLAIIVRGCMSQDAPGSEGADEPRRHFRENNLSRTLSYIDREKRKVINFAATADGSEKDRVRALYHMGLLLHTAQDFYSQSNYIEVKETEANQKKRSYGVNPYAMELVDWGQLQTIAQQQTPGQKPPVFKFENFDKQNPSSAQGQTKLGGATYYKMARELALRETQRQWNSVETLIRNRFGARASQILAALKQATCQPAAVNDALSDKASDVES